MAAVDDKQFVNSYLELISLSSDQKPTFFNSVKEYGNVTSLGPSLPSVKGQFPSSSTTTGTKVKLSFKSIKPPFKFSKELEDVPESENIFNVKSLLIQSLNLEGVKPHNIKLLIKGKVIQDTATVATLDATSFTCMVSQPTPEVAADPEPEVNPSPAMDVDSSISEAAWGKISDVLREELGEVKASEVLTKFKSCI